jgi:hypothetical protein
MTTRTKPKYYVLNSSNDSRMLLYSLPNPSLEDRWWAGHAFKNPPKVPVVAIITEGNEKGELLHYFNSTNLMSNAFYEALLEAGVDNLDVYDAIIQSEDGSVVHKGYKAFNLIGLIRAADMSRTVFRDPPGTTLIDASIEHLEVDGHKPRGLKMFRLAENVSAVLVHEDVKRVLESKGFPHVIFTEPKDFTSL